MLPDRERRCKQNRRDCDPAQKHNPPIEYRRADEAAEITETPRVELSQSLPWEFVKSRPKGLSKRASDALKTEREKREAYRQRLFEEISIHDRSWLLTLRGASEVPGQIADRCPPDLREELAAGGYPVERISADWADLVRDALNLALEAADKRAPAMKANDAG